ncbi:MAG: arginine--tRNA ligase [Candidatus Omnitrophica bacterium]|nr:arginine--tRNA ligase [Candidatus Omnitrophota bacterium]
MKDNSQQLIISVLSDYIKKQGIAQPPEAGLYLDIPAQERFGDLSSNIALILSKSLKRPPIEIARDIVAHIKESPQQAALNDYIKEIKIEGAGFINFYLREEYLFSQLSNLIAQGSKFFRRDSGKGKRVLIEFVSANPTGPLSIAHARQAAVGDVLANILDLCGFGVKREYYLNDEGNQINILGKSVAARMEELAGKTVEFPENYYQGDYIYEIARESQSHQVTKSQDLSEFAANYILAIIKKELEDFGVKFDCWYSQKELGKSGKIEKALDCLKEKGFMEEKEGALWFKSSAFGDDKDRVVIKSDGSYTYLAPDIAYHQEKFKRGFEWLINLWGPDHHGYINRLKASVEASGHPAGSLDIVIVQLATIFKDGKSVEMSTRRGQYITLREVLDEVGRDASRFFFLMRKTSSHLDFDLDIAKKQTPENPVYYVQYAHARICSILKNTQPKARRKTDFLFLKEDEEIGLVKKILQFTSVTEACVKALDPYLLTVYLQELAEKFHKFYDCHRVLGQADELTQARLGLIEATRIAIAAGLEILGVRSPQEM